MAKQLTVEILKELRWKFVLHLNMGAIHSTAYENKKWGLHFSAEVRIRGYKTINRSITAAKLSDYVCDLTADDLGVELDKFVEAYNA